AGRRRRREKPCPRPGPPHPPGAPSTRRSWLQRAERRERRSDACPVPPGNWGIFDPRGADHDAQRERSALFVPTLPEGRWNDTDREGRDMRITRVVTTVVEVAED